MKEVRWDDGEGGWGRVECVEWGRWKREGEGMGEDVGGLAGGK